MVEKKLCCFGVWKSNQIHLFWKEPDWLGPVEDCYKQTTVDVTKIVYKTGMGMATHSEGL